MANYGNNLMGYYNAKGSLEDIQKRLKNIKEQKTLLDEKKKNAERQRDDIYSKFEIAIR